MAWKPLGPSTELQITEAQSNLSLMVGPPHCRVYNAGPNTCRMEYGFDELVISSASMIMPNGFVEVHDKGSFNTFAAKCKTGETCALHIMLGAEND